MEDVADLAELVIVMDNGKVILQDTPVAVFSKADLLESIGLASPQVTYLMRRLKAEGFDVSENIIRVQDAAQEILKALNKGGECK